MTKFLLILPRVIIALQWLGPAAVLYWATGSGRQSRGQTFFGARVEPSFAESETGKAIVSEFQRRLWLWSLAGGIASLMVRIDFASFLSLAGVGIGGSIAFGLANRRALNEAAPVAAPGIRIASLETRDEPQDWWLSPMDWLAMLVPTVAPAAILTVRIFYPNAILAESLMKMSIGFNMAGLIFGMIVSANHWALRYRARSSDWAPTPGASRKYRTYLGAMQSLGMMFMISVCCGFFMPPNYFVSALFIQVLWAVGIFKMRSWLRTHLATGSVDPMPDRCWRWGSFYFNPDDSAIMVPLRTGVGQSMNMARPGVWIAFMLWTATTIGIVIEIAKLRLPNY